MYKTDMLKNTCTNFDKQTKTTETGKKIVVQQENSRSSEYDSYIQKINRK